MKPVVLLVLSVFLVLFLPMCFAVYCMNGLTHHEPLEPIDTKPEVIREGLIAPDGVTAVRWPLRQSDIVKNTGSNIDGVGLGVNACIETAARIQNVKPLIGFFNWSKNQPGGSYPDKMARQLNQFTNAQDAAGGPSPQRPIYAYYSGSDPKKAEGYLAEWIKHGPVMAAYRGSDTNRYKVPVYAMVLVLHYDPAKNLACIYDPNFVNPDQVYYWSTDEHLKSHLWCASSPEYWLASLNAN